jgi:hypothetical protein
LNWEIIINATAGSVVHMEGRALHTRGDSVNVVIYLPFPAEKIAVMSASRALAKCPHET